MNRSASRANLLAATTAVAGAVLAAGLPRPAHAAAAEAPALPKKDVAAAAVPSLDQVVVTARRREERLQEVPISVTSVSDQALQSSGVEGTKALQELTPGLLVAGISLSNQPHIRGVGSQSLLVGDESNVAVHIDGVYVPQMYSTAMKFEGIERVEVLKGPQGTLFGRNATGGVINIITKAPSFTTTGELSVTGGSYDKAGASLYVTGPLTSDLAASLTAFYDTDSGYAPSLVLPGIKYGGVKEGGARAKLLYRPTAKLEVQLSASFLQANNRNVLDVEPVLGSLPKGYVVDPSGPRATAPFQNLQGPLRPYFRLMTSEADAKVTYDAGLVSLMSLTAIRKDMDKSVTDADVTRASVSQTLTRAPSHQFSQEFQATSAPEIPIKFVAGLFYFNDSTEYGPIINMLTGARTFSKVITDAYAAYGEATTPPLFVPGLTFTAGLRYSYEKKENYAALNNVFRYDNHASWGAWTPRFILQYEKAGLFNVYASASRGFKSGQFNSGNLTGIPVQPEYIWAYEVGLKTLVSSQWQADLAAFHYDYKNVQVQAFFAGGAGIALLQNAASEKVNGVEADLDGAIGPNLRGSLGLAYTDATYDRFPDAAVNLPAPPTVGGNVVVHKDESGKRVPLTPKFTANARLAYARPAFGGEAGVTANVYYNSGMFFEPENRLKQGAYATANAQVYWASPGAKYRIALTVYNVTDEIYAQTENANAFDDQVEYAPPRRFDVKLTYQF